MKDWLESLGPGDKVIVTSGAYRDDRIAEVTRTTQTQIVLDDRSKFRKKNGHLVGQKTRWHFTYLVEHTEERATRVHHKELSKTIERIIHTGGLASLTIQELGQIKGILEAG